MIVDGIRTCSCNTFITYFDMAPFYNQNTFICSNVITETLNIFNDDCILFHTATSYKLGPVLYLVMPLTLKMAFKQIRLHIYCPKVSVLPPGQCSKPIYKSILCLNALIFGNNGLKRSLFVSQQTHKQGQDIAVRFFFHQKKENIISC